MFLKEVMGYVTENEMISFKNS